MPKTDLVTRVSAYENDVPEQEVTAAQRNRVNAALSQTHLPAFEELGIIKATDKPDGTHIMLAKNAEEVFSFVGFERGSSVLDRVLSKLS